MSTEIFPFLASNSWGQQRQQRKKAATTMTRTTAANDYRIEPQTHLQSCPPCWLRCHIQIILSAHWLSLSGKISPRPALDWSSWGIGSLCQLVQVGWQSWWRNQSKPTKTKCHQCNELIHHHIAAVFQIFLWNRHVFFCRMPKLFERQITQTFSRSMIAVMILL